MNVSYLFCLVDENESQKKKTSLGCQDTPGFKLLETNLNSFRGFDQIERLKVVGIKLNNGNGTPKVNVEDTSYRKRLDFVQFTLSKPLDPADDIANKENYPIFAKKPPKTKPKITITRPLPSIKKKIMQ